MRTFSAEIGLSSLLNMAHVVAEGILIHKDGSLLTSFRFQGPDLHSVTGEERDSLTDVWNRAMLLLGDGWMVHVDELRVPSLHYPEAGAFPDDISLLIDEERRQQYETFGTHYENWQFLTLVWKPPMPKVRFARHWFVEGVSKEEEALLSQLLTEFEALIERIEGLLKRQVRLTRLGTADVLSFLTTCIGGELLPVALPPDGCFLDVALGRYPVIGGYRPQIGKKKMRAISLLGYTKSHSMAGVLEGISTYPLTYRWSNRFIPLSEETAEKEIKRYQKNWNNKIKGLMGMVREAITGRSPQKLNHDALHMHEQTQLAETLNSQKGARFGFWSSTVILHHEDDPILREAEKVLRTYVESQGFACMTEEVNAMDAWLGSIPGHGSANVRWFLIPSHQLAHFLPLHTLWAGRQRAAKESVLPPNAPPVLYADTTGQTPFRFHLDCEGVGHQLVLGPTGSGKTTYLDLLMAQFLRYPHAHIFCFDKSFSHQGLIKSVNGHYADLGEAKTVSFCPLAKLETPSQLLRAERWIENLITLQGVTLVPAMRTAIHTAMQTLAHPTHQGRRNLTVFRSMVQHQAIRDALTFYTVAGSFQALDATEDKLSIYPVQGFEMGWLLSQPPEIFVPVLLYLFDHIETFLEQANATCPTLIVLEEAWLYLSHPLFVKTLTEWLKTLRKYNARVIFATQSLSDLYNPETRRLTRVTSVLLESCFVRVYLPHPLIDSEAEALYQHMGLSAREIQILKTEAQPKQHYYVTTTEGRRLVELGLEKTPLARAFVGLSKEAQAELLALASAYPEDFQRRWLERKGFDVDTRLTPVSQEPGVLI